MLMERTKRLSWATATTPVKDKTGKVKPAVVKICQPGDAGATKIAGVFLNGPAIEQGWVAEKDDDRTEGFVKVFSCEQIGKPTKGKNGWPGEPDTSAVTVEEAGAFLDKIKSSLTPATVSKWMDILNNGFFLAAGQKHAVKVKTGIESLRLEFMDACFADKALYTEYGKASAAGAGDDFIREWAKGREA